MKYRKKPVVIDAFKWTGGHDQTEDPEWIVEAIEKGVVTVDEGFVFPPTLHIKTLEGVVTAQPGDYIIRGIQNEIYPCKADIFEATYEAAYPHLNQSRIGRFIVSTNDIRNHTYAVMDLLRDVVIVEATHYFDDHTEYVGISHLFEVNAPGSVPRIYAVDRLTHEDGTVKLRFEGER